MEITYGLYLSDHAILDAVDTELVVLAGIAMQNLKTETGWHLRGTRRIGVSLEDTERVLKCVSCVDRRCSEVLMGEICVLISVPYRLRRLRSFVG